MDIRFGAFALDCQQRRLWRGEAEVRLTPMAFTLLSTLVAQTPRVVSKQELHAALWPDTFVSDATLVGLVKELRRALDDRDARTTIRTVNRVGYAFGAPLAPSSPPSAVFRHWLKVNGRRVPLQPGPNLIGRDPQSTVWLDFASVSRRHAQIAVTGAEARLEDLASKNGTLIGAHRVTAAAPLKDGDQIAVGTVRLTYHTSAVGASTETDARTLPAPVRGDR